MGLAQVTLLRLLGLLRTLHEYISPGLRPLFVIRLRGTKKRCTDSKKFLHSWG